MAKICLCLTAKTLARDLEILDKYRKFADLAELRVDCLDSDERFQLRSFPEKAGMPVILTVRRRSDGGHFVEGEAMRAILLSKGLAFADADRRKNFAFVDLEEDLQAPSLEEAARTFGTRIIRSYHNLKGVDDDLEKKLRSMRRVGDELVKAAVMPHSLADVLRAVKAAKATADMEKILLCMGDFGVNTRILAPHLGSYLSYTTVKGEAEVPSGAPGQLDPRELAESYRFRDITPETKIFAVSGFPLTVSASPAFFNSVFGIEKTDAVYVPIPAESVASLLAYAEEMNILGISVTVPYKEEVMPRLCFRNNQVSAIGACNTLVGSPQGWMGYNTDARGFSDSLLAFTGLKNFKGRKITIVGAGGAARAVAYEIARLRGKALILNRTAVRAREVAASYGFAWAGLEPQSVPLIENYRDIIIQTTNVGMDPHPDEDPLAFYNFTGKEIVMDLIYKPAKTRLLDRAEKSGCRIQNGYDMLLRQARLQYEYYLHKEFPPSLVNRVGFGKEGTK